MIDPIEALEHRLINSELSIVNSELLVYRAVSSTRGDCALAFGGVALSTATMA